MRHPVGDAAQHVVQPLLISLGKIMQDVTRHPVFVAGMSHTHADPVVMRPDMLMDGTQPIMPRMPAARLAAQLAGGEVNLVMKHGHICAVELVEPHGLPNRLARLVHEGCGFQQHDLLRAQAAFADLPLKLRFPRPKPVILRHSVQRHEANIMPVARIFYAGIAEACKEFHVWMPYCRDAGARVGFASS